MALCAPILHVTSWQNAVKAVSGLDIFEDVMSDLTGRLLDVLSSCLGSSTDGEESAGKIESTRAGVGG